MRVKRDWEAKFIVIKEIEFSQKGGDVSKIVTISLDATG